MTMQVFVRDDFAMVAAPVQRDVDGICTTPITRRRFRTEYGEIECAGLPVNDTVFIWSDLLRRMRVWPLD